MAKMQVWENFYSSTPTDYSGDEPESRLEIKKKNKPKFLIKMSHFTLSGNLYRSDGPRTPVIDIDTWVDVVHLHETRLLDTKSIFRTQSPILDIKSNMELFAKIINSYVSWTIFAKSFVLDIRIGSEYAFGQGSDTTVLTEIIFIVHNSKFVSNANLNVLENVTPTLIQNRWDRPFIFKK